MASTTTILLGAITAVNSEPNSCWREGEKDEFISLLAQLAHCPAAPPPPTTTVVPSSVYNTSSRHRSGSTATLTSTTSIPVSVSVPVPTRANPATYAYNNNNNNNNNNTSAGVGGRYNHPRQSHLALPPTPPLSPTLPGLPLLVDSSSLNTTTTTTTTTSAPSDRHRRRHGGGSDGGSGVITPQQQQQQIPSTINTPLSLATCLTLNRSHSISAAGLEVAAEYAERLNVPRESMVLIGVAHVLRSFYVGQMRRGPLGYAKGWRRRDHNHHDGVGDVGGEERFGGIAAMEGCKECACLDYDLAIGLDGLVGGERCGCGHGYGMHRSWKWESPLSSAGGGGDGGDEIRNDRGEQEEEEKEEEHGRDEKDEDDDDDEEDSSFAQTADDSFLFETDDEESSRPPSRNNTSTSSSSQRNLTQLSYPISTSTSPSSSSLSSPSPSLSPSPSHPHVLLQTLPTSPSPGIHQLLKRFTYWTLWSYSSLLHPSSTGHPKTDLRQVRSCVDCNCADFYLDTKWLRRHSRHLSRESLRSLSRRQSLSFNLTPSTPITTATTTTTSTGSGSDGAGGRSVAPARLYEGGVGVGVGCNSVITSQPRPTSRLSLSYPEPTPSSSSSSSSSYPSISNPTSTSTSSSSSAAVQSTSSSSYPERPSSRASFRSSYYPERPSSRASMRSFAGSSYGGGGGGGGSGSGSGSGSRRNTLNIPEEPQARCACGHSSSNHVKPGPTTDLSWILVEWAYVALARLGGAATAAAAAAGDGGGDGGRRRRSVVGDELSWPLSDEAGKEEALWRRGRDVRM